MLAGQEPGAEPGLRQRRQRAVAQLGGRSARDRLRRALAARRARGMPPRLKPRKEPGPDQAGQRRVAAGRGRGRVRRRIGGAARGMPCAGSSRPRGLAGRRARRACRVSGARPFPTRRRLCCARPGFGLGCAPGLARVRVPRRCGAALRAAAPPRRRHKQPGRQRWRRRRRRRRHPPVACIVPRRCRTIACLPARTGRPMLGGCIRVVRRAGRCLGLSEPRGMRAAAGRAGGTGRVSRGRVGLSALHMRRAGACVRSAGPLQALVWRLLLARALLGGQVPVVPHAARHERGARRGRRLLLCLQTQTAVAVASRSILQASKARGVTPGGVYRLQGVRRALYCPSTSCLWSFTQHTQALVRPARLCQELFRQ